MPWRSASGSLPKAMSNRSLSPTRPAIAAGLEQSIRILPSWSTVMKPKRGIDPVVHDREVEPVPLGDRRPVGQRGAAHRVHADAEPAPRGSPRGRSPRRDRRRRPRPGPPGGARRPAPVARDAGWRAARVRPCSSWFARSWIQPVTSVSAGPPLGGLYLKPPSSGGLCDGVMTMPSASRRSRPAFRSPFQSRIAREITGVGVQPSSGCTTTSTPFAASTSSAVRSAAAERRGCPCPGRAGR